MPLCSRYRYWFYYHLTDSHFVFIIGEEKGEIFRKSLSCVPCQSDSDDCDGVGSDVENHKKTTKPKKIEETSVKESSERRNKKESHRKVLQLRLKIKYINLKCSSLGSLPHTAHNQLRQLDLMVVTLYSFPCSQFSCVFAFYSLQIPP